MERSRKPRKILSDQLIARLAKRGDAKAYSRDELVLVEGEDADSLFILVSGQVKVFTKTARGRQLVYNILGPGEIFGELFLDGGARSASVKAVVASQCVVVSAAQFSAFIQDYPEFAECLIYSLIARLRHATQLTKSIALSGAYERTISLLNEVAMDEGGKHVIPRAMTQQEIADRVGATREMVNGILGELMRGGHLSRDERHRLVFVRSLPLRW